MRLKPGALTEASAVFSLAWILILISFIVISGDIGKAVNAATLSLLFLLPCYTLWGLIGLAVRKRTRNVKFFMNISVNKFSLC